MSDVEKYDLKLHIDPWGQVTFEEMAVGLVPSVFVSVVDASSDLPVLDIRAAGVPFENDQAALDLTAEILALALASLRAVGADVDDFEQPEVS